MKIEEMKVRLELAESVTLPKEQVMELITALEESLKLQAHYARLLNMRDGGRRTIFESADAWLGRLAIFRGGS